MMIKVVATTLQEDFERLGLLEGPLAGGEDWLLNAVQQLSESSLKKYSNKGDVVYMYGQGNGANAIVGKRSGKFDLLLLKRNRFVSRSGAAFIGLKISDKASDLALWARYAKDEKILRTKKPYRVGLSPEKFKEQMVNELGYHLSIVEEIFPETKGINQENVLNVGGFEIFYQNKKEAEQISSILESSCKILSKHGFKKLCYGQVISTPKLKSGSVLADYMPTNDVVRISNKSKKSKDAVRHFIHELGHRLIEKYLKKSHIDSIKLKYKEVMLDTSISVSLGDRFKLDSGETVKIDGVDASGLRVWYKYKKMDGNSYKATKDYLSGLERVGKPNKAKNIFNVSLYSRASYEEFFCEVFSFALVDNNRDLLAWIENFKK